MHHEQPLVRQIPNSFVEHDQTIPEAGLLLASLLEAPREQH